MKLFVVLILILLSMGSFASHERRAQPQYDPRQENVAEINSTEVIFAVNSIERYLDDYPNAMDTLEGIHCWWIEWPNTPPDTSVTLMALEVLRKDGVVEQRRFGSKTIWRKVRI